MKLRNICPICGKKSGLWIEKYEDSFDPGPKGWYRVILYPNCPPYFVCSVECRDKLKHQIDLVEALEAGDKNVVIEKRKDGTATIYRKENGYG